MNDNDIKNSFLTQTIDGRFSNIAKAFPDNIAYSDSENTVTYKQLSTQVDLIASIIQKNLPDENLVGLYFEQSLEFIICFLAVIRAGKVAVPLDTKSPENRLLRLISHAEIQTIIKGNKLPSFDNKELTIIPYSDLCQKESGALTLSDDINNEAVILYTSGSTGESKGVIHAHKSLMHHTYRFTKLLSLSHTDRSTLLYNTAYFGGLRDILSALLNGGALYHYSIEKNGYSQLPTWLEKNKITIYTSVITVFRQLCNAIKKGEDLKNSDLRAVRIGSDVCLKSDFEKYKTYFPDKCIFVSGFASSETGLIRQNILTKDSIVTDSIPNGYPVEDVDVYIKDNQGVTLEDGEIGTLVIASDYLSLGYKNMPELTVDKYKINSSGKREFWSGDTGYIKNGSLVFSGRTDAQVKISGRRIDLAEIDSVVMDLNGITNSTALYYEETKSIILFVEISKNNLLSKEDISKYLSDHLPFYMQPTRIIALSTFPLSPSFKVNKKELYTLIKKYEHPYIEPTNVFETEVIKIFCNILNKEKIGIHDSFFELGGDSISATTATVMLEKIFNIEIPYGYLYQAQTAQLFAQAIQANNFDKPLKWLSLINQGSGVPICWILNGATTLKKYLPDDQELYVINTHYDHDIPNRQTTIENICSEFSEEILRVNRGKRCIIGGFSMGARFAYETAQQLKKVGMTIDLLILLDPTEKKSATERTLFQLGHTYDRIKMLYYTYTNSVPPASFKHEYIYQFYKSLRNKQLLSNYDGKVLLMQRKIDVAFEHRDWPKIAHPTNLIFATLDIDDHLAVVNDSNVQLQWIDKIKEHI